MRIVKRLSPCELIVEKIYSANEIRAIEDNLLKQKNQEITLPGFRRGFAPAEKIREIAEKSPDWEEGLSIALQKKFLFDWNNDLGKTQGNVVQISSIEKTGQNPLTLAIKCECWPGFELGPNNSSYKKLEVGKGRELKDLKATSQEVEAALKEIQKRRAVLKPTRLPLGKNIHAFINISHAGRQGKDLFQWGEKQYGEEFDNKTKGLKEGAEKKLAVSLQEGSARIGKVVQSKEITPEGKTALSIKIEKTFTLDVPDLDDEFAKSMGKFQNLTELKDNLKQGLQLEKFYREKAARREKLIDSLIKEYDLPIPQSLISRNAKRAIRDFDLQTAQKLGISREELRNRRAKEENAKLDEIFLAKSEKELKLQKILEAIALKEKIVPDEKDVDKETRKILAAFTSPREAKKALGSPQDLENRITLSLCLEKTLSFLEKENQLGQDLDGEIKKVESDMQRKDEHHH